jgi:hypothetical protein
LSSAHRALGRLVLGDESSLLKYKRTEPHTPKTRWAETVIEVVPRHLRGLGNRSEMLRRRALVPAVLLAVVVAGLLWVRHRASLTAMERKLVGSWVSDDSPRTMRVLTFAADRRVTGRVVDRLGGPIAEILGDKDETWFVDGQTVFVRRGRKGSASYVERVTGRDFLWDQWPIASLTDDTLVVADRAKSYRFDFKRGP